VDVQRVTREGNVILYIECPDCHNRVFMVDGSPLSGAEAEKELRVGFEAHVKEHEAAGETPMGSAKGRHR
jgi:hypothetical protein